MYTNDNTWFFSSINKKGAKYKGGEILPENGENVENKIWKKITMILHLTNLSGRAPLVAKRLQGFCCVRFILC